MIVDNKEVDKLEFTIVGNLEIQAFLQQCSVLKIFNRGCCFMFVKLVRIGKDAELKQSNSGKSFSVAVCCL